MRRLNEDLERRVGERTAELSEANKELEAFSFSVSHDLRTPLSQMGGFAEIIEEDAGPGMSPENLRYLKIIRKSADRMGQLIEDLLAFSQLGRKPLSAARIDMGRLAQTVLDDLIVGRDGKTEIRLEALPEGWGDEALIRQVWANLLTNALKFSSHEEKPLVTIGSRIEGGETIYFVRDNGAGFDMQHVEKLFTAFQRLHNASKYPGTGLGLALVQRIVTRHGGRVWAEGTEGAGALFHFSLPARLR